MDAAPSGIQSNSANTVSTAAPSSVSSTASMDSLRLGRHLVLQPGEFDADLRWEQVDARRGDLTEFDVDAAGFLKDATQPDTERLRSVLGRTRL